MAIDPRTPVLIGYGQVNQHDDHPGVEPVDLMVAAARAAADPRVLEAVDSVRVVNVLSWRYRDPGLLLAQRLRAKDAATRYTGVGGNVPQTLVNQACLDIQAGRTDTVLIAGAETWRTRTRLRASGAKSGKLSPSAPDDLVAALGALGRKVYVVRSLGLVVTRTGDNSDLKGEPPFDNEFWKVLMKAAPVKAAAAR